MSEPGHIAEATVRVDAGATLGPIRRIWTSFGYDEINWTSMPAGKRHLQSVRAFAEQPYFVRSHYIFNSGIGWSLPHWGSGNVFSAPSGTSARGVNASSTSGRCPAWTTASYTWSAMAKS